MVSLGDFDVVTLSQGLRRLRDQLTQDRNPDAGVGCKQYRNLARRNA